MRAGIVTASHAKDILTAKTLKPSEGRAYMLRLVAEWLYSRPLDDSDSPGGFRGRGTDLEDEARRWYEFEVGGTLSTVGFVTTDDGLLGCSPDSLVGDVGLAQFKVPALTTHIGYIVDPESIVAAYAGQCRVEMLVTGRKWCDLVSWHPDLRKVLMRVEPDAAWTTAFMGAYQAFQKRLDAAKAALAEDKAYIDANPMSDAAFARARDEVLAAEFAA